VRKPASGYNAANIGTIRSGRQSQESEMSLYSNVLLAVDLTENSERIGQRALALAGPDARIHLLHVVEYIPVEPMGEALLPTVQIEEELVQRAKTRLAELAARLNLQQSSQLVETGSIKGEIVRIAQEKNVDLIVLGSRERHGLAILVNFTEDTILHQAPCDVLAVRLR
jgi:universal stress protein A